MNIEVVEFYPNEYREEKGVLTGTLRVKLPDLGIHLLGVYVSKRKNFWYFNLPGRKSIHHETGEPVRFPFIVFGDPGKQKELITAIREKGREFIEKRLADTVNPLIFPQEKKAKTKNSSAPPIKKITPERKNSTQKPKVWIDPPKRKFHTKMNTGKKYALQY